MSQRTTAFIYSKSVLAFAIASVLSSWALGEGTSNGFNPDEWPPNKTKVISDSGTDVVIPEGELVSPSCTGSETSNIVVKDGATLVNKGTITGGTLTVTSL